MKNFKKGFTLVEMLIVVVIIGLLAVALLPTLQGAQASTRDTTRKAALNQIAQGLELYNVSRGSYPGALSWTADAAITADQLSGDLVPDYMKHLPTDPQKNQIIVIQNVTFNPAATAGNFAIIKKGNDVFLVSKVERAENANWTTGTALPEKDKLCTSVEEDANDSVTTLSACKVKKENFLFVLPL